MTFSLQHAIVYDCEVLPNCFTFAMEQLHGDTHAVWEISEYRDDRRELLQFFQYLAQNQIPMIGFNNVGYDYPVIHTLWKNPAVTNAQLYEKSKSIIASDNRFDNTIWASDRFAPQIDLFTQSHFDNRAKSTGLKTLQINMRSPNVVEADVPFDKPISKSDIDNILIPYNRHDVQETKRFAHLSAGAIEFRIGMIDQFGVDVLNWNDTKIGEQMVIQRLGDEVCYDRSNGRRRVRQTPRTQIALNDIIFPYIQFEHPEFNRILTYLRGQVLKADELSAFGDEAPVIKTKGVFTDLKATVDGLDYFYGTGGIHASVDRRRIFAGGGYSIVDIDVAALYPSIGIVNKLAPEHLGQAFVHVYGQLPIERKKWQAEKGKKCNEANAIKLAQNGGVFGKSNSVYSPMYDPQFPMTITVNGQLMLSMLVERLLKVPTLSIIQANTDGITYHIRDDYKDAARQVWQEWEKLTQLTLEDVEYAAMFIKDVNNYVSVGVDGSTKLKGVYWTPDPANYHDSIANGTPVSWHKNFSNCVSVRAAVAHMTQGTDIETYIRLCTDPYDFCNAVKIRRSDKLLWGGVEQQRNTRFYVSTDGQALVKHLPAQGTPGAFKKANGVSDAEYARVMSETGSAWDERVCTKNQSRYEARESQIMAGHLVTIVNDIRDFNWETVNYDWYINEAKKLLI